MIDLHCHPLVGIDDGPATLEGALALARRAAAEQTQTIVATPHVSWRYPNDATTIAAAAARLREALAQEHIELEIRTGAEIAMTRLNDLTPRELRDLTLGGGRWLLVEPPFAAVAGGLDVLVRDLLSRGHGVVLAHPERCPAFHRDPGMLESLAREGALLSLTASSLSGRFGRRVRAFALDLSRRGLVHNVASDAHDANQRPPEMRAAIEQAGLGELTDWLTREVPEAILADAGEIPARPQVTLPRPARWRLGLPRG